MTRHRVSDTTMADTVETTSTFSPKFGPDGLLTGIVTDAASGALLMVAHLNQAAIDATLASGDAHFWSRSRAALWKKGETSGNVLRVVEMRIDCDQDALWLICEPAGPACHTGQTSCFYRRLSKDGGLELIA
jgi:phosphoribosyl-AMP cyclohydrolase